MNIHYGLGAPSGALGVDGDFYFDTVVPAIYGPKTAGAWGAGTVLVPVAEDIARSAGGAIDRVQGLRGVPLANEIPGTGELWRKVASQYKAGKPAYTGAWSVLDYGAVPDGNAAAGSGTDNLAAFNAAMDAMGSTPQSETWHAGGILLVPPGVYYFSDNLRVRKNVILSGSGSTGISGITNTVLVFPAGKGIIYEKAKVTTVGRADGASIKDLGIYCRPYAGMRTWNYATPFDVGDKVFLPYSHRYWYECIKAGTTSARPVPAWTASEVVTAGAVRTPTVANGHRYICVTGGTCGTTEPTWQLEYREPNAFPDNGVVWREYGDFVMYPDDGRRPLFGQWPLAYNATKDDPRVNFTVGQAYGPGSVIWVPTISEENDKVFVYVSPADAETIASANTSPLSNWNVPYGSTVVVGGITWRAMQASKIGYFTIDGDAVFMCHTAAGLALECGINVNRIVVVFAMTAGVHLQGEGPLPNSWNVNYWRLSHVYTSNCGVSILVHGWDANAGIAIACGDFSTNANAPNEWQEGFVDEGFTGNAWFGCSQENRYGPPAVSLQPTGMSLWSGCYGENNMKPRIYQGTITGGTGQFGNPMSAWSKLTHAVVLNGLIFNFSTTDNRVSAPAESIHTLLGSGQTLNEGMWHLACYLQGVDAGWSGLVRTDALETHPSSPFPKGWIIWLYHPEAYGAGVAGWAVGADGALALRDNPFGSGQFAIPRSEMYFGKPGTNEQLFGFRSAYPTGSAGYKFKRGDAIVNTNVSALGVDHWRCVADGNAGTSTPATFVPVAATSGLYGQVTITLTGSGRTTLSASADVALGMIKLAGTPNAGHVIGLPTTTDAGAYEKLIRNTTAVTIRVDTGTGTPYIDIASGAQARIYVDSSGVFT